AGTRTTPARNGARAPRTRPVAPCENAPVILHPSRRSVHRRSPQILCLHYAGRARAVRRRPVARLAPPARGGPFLFFALSFLPFADEGAGLDFLAAVFFLPKIAS